MCNSSSLLRCLMMYYCVSHRCLTIVMQRMFCQRSTLHVGNSCYIMLHPRSDGAPQKCQWMPLCSVALSPHVLSLAKYLTRAFERFPKSQSHLQQIPLSCHSSVHMAHSKSPNNLSPSLFFHSVCIRSSLYSTPCRPHRPVPGPGLCRPQHRRRHPLRGAAPPRRRGQWQPRGAAVSNLRRRRARRRQRLAPPRGSSTAHPHCSGRNCNLWSEVREFHLFQNRIAS